MKKYKILLVDDELLILKGIGQCIEEEGYQVVTAGSGEDAVELMKDTAFDVVITDIVMDRIDGISVLKKSKEINPEAMVIILTGYGDMPSAIAAIRLDADDYLLKPCEPDELIYRLSRCIKELELKRKTRRAEDELKRNYDTQTVLNSLLTLSLKDIPLQDILNSAIDLILSIPWLVFESQSCVFFVEDEHEVLEMKAQKGLSEAVKNRCKRVSFGECICGKTASTQEIIFADSTDNLHETQEEGIKPHIQYCVPIIFAGRTIGVINIYLKPGHQRDKKEEEFLTAIANTLAGIIQRKRMEEEKEHLKDQLFQAQKLESIGTLAGGIAHDFNNLLTVILGNIALAQVNTNPDDEMYKLLASCEDASERAKDLANKLLTFSKGGSPVKKKVSIDKLIEESAGFTLSGSNMRCTFSLFPTLWPVEVDEGQMSQAIHNIVINAREAVPEGGTIRIKAENVTVEAKDIENEKKSIELLKKARYIKLSIEDEGSGIPKENLSKIFDPYFTTKELGPQKGMGLGLSICHSIIKKHDGYITVESKMGAGTTFHIYLPASEEELLIMKDKEESMIAGRGRVLIMDDEEIVRAVIGEMIKAIGYEVEFASEGTKAIELYKKSGESGESFDAVILDLTVKGGMGGKEAIKKLLQIDPEIKAIVSSGYSNDPIIDDFRVYGFKGSIAKPYKIKELSEILHRVISCV